MEPTRQLSRVMMSLWRAPVNVDVKLKGSSSNNQIDDGDF